MALIQKGDNVMGTQLPQILPVTTEKPTYSQALVAYALCHKGQLYMVAYQYNFIDGKTIEEQERIIRNHLLQPADSNGDRPVDQETLTSVSRITYNNKNINFSDTFQPLAENLDKTSKEQNCTVFVVVTPYGSFSSLDKFNQNSSYNSIWASVRRSGRAALDTLNRHR
jgi:hypothetical protein